MDKRVIKQQRIDDIPSSLKNFDYLSRSQIQAVHDLKGTRNTNRFLQSMNEYLSSFRSGHENVYYLNKVGRDRIGCEVIRKKTPQADHYLLRNQLWIYLRRPKSWDNEVRISAGDISIVCDAMFEYKGRQVFVEVDVCQPMRVNQKKIEKYKRLQQMSQEKFYLWWVTSIEGRRERLNSLMSGMHGRVFTWNEIK